MNESDSPISANVFDHERLSITLIAVSRRGVARVADCVRPFEPLEHIFGEDVGYVAHFLMREYLIAIRRGNPCALLPAMLQGIQAQVRHARGV